MSWPIPTGKVPTPTGTEAAVCADIARRQQFGLAKYGVTVAGNPLSLRAWLQHAYEESLDHAVYLRRAMDQIDADEIAAAAAEEPLHTGELDEGDYDLGLDGPPNRRRP